MSRNLLLFGIGALVFVVLVVLAVVRTAASHSSKEEPQRKGESPSRSLKGYFENTGKAIRSLLAFFNTPFTLPFAFMVFLTLAAKKGWWRSFPGSDNQVIAGMWEWYAAHWGVVLAVALFAFFLTLAFVSLFKADKAKVVPWIAIAAVLAIVFMTEGSAVSHLFTGTHHDATPTFVVASSQPPAVKRRPCDGTYDCHEPLAFHGEPESDAADKPETDAMLCMRPDQQWSEHYQAKIWKVASDGSSQLLGVFPLWARDDQGKQRANPMPPFDRIAFVRDSPDTKDVDAWFIRSGQACM